MVNLTRRHVIFIFVGGSLLLDVRSFTYICHRMSRIVRYDHGLEGIGHPVRSAIHKLAYANTLA